MASDSRDVGQARELEHPLSTRKKVLFTVIIVVIVLVFIEFASFAVLRLRNADAYKGTFHPLWQGPLSPGLFKVELFDNYMGWRFKPLSSYSRLETDSYGFIKTFGRNNYSTGQDFDIYSSKPGETRVFMLGGSTLMGSGVPDNRQTIPSYFQVLSEATFPSMVTINAGVGGHTSFSELNYFANELSRLSPDAVIVFDGYNDIKHSAVTKTHDPRGGFLYPNKPGANLDAVIIYINSSRGVVGGFATFLKATSDYSYTLTVLHGIGKRISRTTTPDIESLPQGFTRTATNVPGYYTYQVDSKQMAIDWAENLDSIIGICKAKDITVIICLQPTLAMKTTRSAEEEELLKKMEDDYPGWTGRLITAWKLLQEQAENLKLKYSEDDRVVVDDLTGLFDGRGETLYVDRAHYTASGNEIIAQKLYSLYLQTLTLHQ